MNIYNKKPLCKNGTLIGNWHEEQALRNFTGEGRYLFFPPKMHINQNRAAVPEHIPKKTADLENPITHSKVFDNTHDRIHGQKQYELYCTHNHFYGATKNPVDDFPKTGKRHDLLESTVCRFFDSFFSWKGL